MENKMPQAVQSCHKMMLWIIPQLDKFPRSRRFTLGEKIEQSMLDVLRLLVEATYAIRGKSRLLEQVNTSLSVLKHLWRLAFELGTIAKKQYGFGAGLMVDLGRQIGGWQKSSQ
jgi:hypothetical protein